jgi:hypothetical protein
MVPILIRSDVQPHNVKHASVTEHFVSDLAPVAFTGHDMALSFENIFLPAVPRPDKPEGVDSLARRAREFHGNRHPRRAK